MKSVHLISAIEGYKFTLDIGPVSCYFNVLKKDGNAYKAGVFVGVASCRDSLCQGLSIAHETNDTTHLGKGSILVWSGEIAKNIDNTHKLLHYVEDQLKISRTRLLRTQYDNCFVARIDAYWMQRPYLLSLWSLLIRISIHYNKTKFTDPKDFLDKYNGDYWFSNYRVYNKLKHFIEHGTYITPTFGYYGTGIVAVQIPGFIN